MLCREYMLGLARQADPHEIHRMLWLGFDAPRGAVRPFLWRSDDSGRGVVVLMRTFLAPTKIVWVDHPLCSWVRGGVEEYRLTDGQIVEFRLRCNPIWAEPQGYGTRSKRRSLTAPGDIRHWFGRRGGALGFEPVDVTITDHRPVRWSRNARVGVHGSVDLGGVLRITDAAAFQETMLAGVGAAKAFGFGLFEIEEVSS